MFDTINFRLTERECKGVDFLEEVSPFLDDISEHYYRDEPIIMGAVGGLKVSLSRAQMRVKDGSLCKFFLGDNYKALGRRDTARAVEKLSDILHIPMSRAIVTRLDVAQNFVVKHPPEVYMNHLGVLRYATRLQEPSGIYYSMNGGRLCFYDKNKEQRARKEVIPELYEGRNVLRYERRYCQRLSKRFNVAEVSAGMLTDEGFYRRVLDEWRGDYQAIKKINEYSLNFSCMRTKQQLYKMGILALIEREGGQMNVLAQIDEAQKKGELTRKQAYDLRVAVNEACKAGAGLTAPSEAIKELDKKVLECVNMYR